MNSHMCRGAYIVGAVSMAGLPPAATAEALIKAFSGPAAAAVLKSKGMQPAS